MVRGEAARVVMRVRELLMLLCEGRVGVRRGVGAPSGPFACSHLDFPEKENGEKNIEAVFDDCSLSLVCREGLLLLFPPVFLGAGF